MISTAKKVLMSKQLRYKYSSSVAQQTFQTFYLHFAIHIFPCWLWLIQIKVT